ncbi:response regulator transcription factor [Cohnella zeiphila]|uniref:Response regulator n=1 Tax=Cohnella zeiphila TaxID=2761120 RepID=A0A7X0SLK4_9BACL|nr:response regulator [Cohnella zeiphila]MBB6729963.1 response regulator [Cohnella zeiphila]
MGIDTRPEPTRWHERMYQAVLERYWKQGEGSGSEELREPASGEAATEPFGLLLVRFNPTDDETMRRVVTRIRDELELEPEPAGALSAIYDPAGRQAALLLFGFTRSRTHYAALMAKRMLLELAPGPFALLAAEAGAQPERDPLFFERLADRFAAQPEQSGLTVWNEPDPADESTGQSLLLVDGDEDMRRFLRQRFSRKGYRVLDAGDGPEGLRLFREMKPDVVVTDLNVAGIDGYHLLTLLQEEDPEARSKIVVFTDIRTEDAVRRCLGLGADDYLTRPFSPVELEERIEKLLA